MGRSPWLGVALGWLCGLAVLDGPARFCIDGWLRPTLEPSPATAPACDTTMARLVAMPPALCAVQVLAYEGQARIGERVHTQARVKVVARCEGGVWHPLNVVVRLRLPDRWRLQRHDVLWLRLALHPLPPARGPWERRPTDAQAAVRWVARVHSPPVRVAQRPSLGAWIDAARARWAARLHHVLPPSSAAMACALALGDAGAIKAPLRQAFADAGLAHVLAVSGLHVSLVAASCFAVGRRLCAWARLGVWPDRMAALASVPCLWLYALLAGASASSVRAALMASVLLLARAAGVGHATPWHGWAFSLVVFLAGEPAPFEQMGAVLSFACVAALLVLGPVVARGSRGWRRVVWALMGGAALNALMAPFCAAYFGRVSYVAPAINVLAIPWASAVATPLALLLTVLAAMGGPLWLAHAVALPTHAALVALAQLARVAATLPHAAGEAAPWPLPWAIGLWVAAFGLRFGVQQRALPPLLRRLGRQEAGLFAALLLALGVLGAWPARQASPQGALHLYVIDVGHGSAHLVHTPAGHWVLIDGGGALYSAAPDPGRLRVLPALRQLGVKQLDVVVLSHPHPDHANGLAAVFKQLPVRCFLYNADAERSAHVRPLIAAVRAQGHVARRAPASLALGETMLQLRQPLADARASVNDRSIVVLVEAFGRRLLLPGDIEQRGEAALLNEPVQADVLLLAHHGSNTSSHAAFLQHVRARLLIVSCGAAHRFGFPHPSVVARTRAYGPLWATSEQGGIQVCLRTSGVAVRSSLQPNWRWLADGRLGRNDLAGGVSFSQ